MKDKITKQFFLFIVAFLVLITLGVASEYAQKSGNFQGTWTWKKGAEEFELTLRQNGDKLTGYHFAIGQNGNKVDEADTTGEPSIIGTIEDNTAKIKFTSAYPDGNGKGTAKIILHRRHLYWKITSSSGEYYLPLSATLKIKKQPAQIVCKNTAKSAFRIRKNAEQIIGVRTRAATLLSKVSVKFWRA